MKIIFATHEGVPLYRGGPYIKMIETKKQLESRGIETCYFDMWKANEQLADCDLVHLFGANFAVYNLARNLKSRNIKFVVNPIFYTRRSPAFVRQITRIDKLTRKYFRGLWWDYGFTREICEWAEMVLPNTIAEGDIIADGMGVPKSKFKVIHNGVSKEFMDGDPALFKKQYGLENFILNVGHIGPKRKNMLALVRALQKIDHPAVLIARVMNTGEAKAVVEKIKHSKNILLIEGLPNNSPLLASAYAACDVFAMPSQFETPGRAALEAALAGAKIVITPHGGTKDYFENIAEYVNPYSIDDIKQKIEKALNKPKTNLLKEHIRKNFLWEKITQDTIDVYNKVLDIEPE